MGRIGSSTMQSAVYLYIFRALVDVFHHKLRVSSHKSLISMHLFDLPDPGVERRYV